MTFLRRAILLGLTFFVWGFAMQAIELGHNVPKTITVCFSAELLGNTRGEITISYEEGIVRTPFAWFNALAEDY